MDAVAAAAVRGGEVAAGATEAVDLEEDEVEDGSDVIRSISVVPDDSAMIVI